MAEASARITGDELLALADNTVQVIWGEFMGVLPDGKKREWLTIRAIDSSFYEVETSGDAAIEKLKSRFSDVRIVENAS